LSDYALSDFLLQLIQVVQHDTNYDSNLLRFLLIRALGNRQIVGQRFFWMLYV